jgi:putative redox protein
MIVDSSGAAGPSPVDALCAALAGCMSVDVVHILSKGRHHLVSVQSRLTAERAGQEPRRLVAVGLHFTIEGRVPREAVERAIELSRDKYCSVWHSLRQDIALRVTFDVGGHEAKGS